MARPIKTITVEDVFPPQTTTPNALPTVSPGMLYHEEDDVDDDDVTALNNVLAELGASETGGGFVNIYRVKKENNGTKTDEYIGRFDAAEFAGGGLLESIKSQWGGGTYKIGVYLHGGRGLKTRKLITIAPDPVAPATMPVSREPDMTPILAAIQKNNEQTMQGLTMIAQALQSKQPSRADMLSEMQIMAEMFKNGAPAAPVQYNPIEMMKMGMEMAQMGGGGDNNNMWVGKMIETFGGPMMEMLTVGARTPPTPRIPSPPVQNGASPATETPPVLPNTEDNAVNNMIVSYLQFLERAAAKRAPVDEYADSILNMVGDSNVSELEAFLKAPNWRLQVATRTNVVERYPEWFTALRDTLLQFIAEDNVSAETSESPVLTSEIEAGSVPMHDNPIPGQP